MKIHMILSECTSFIETAEIDDPSNDYFVLRNTKYLLLVQAVQRVNDSKGHADWQGRRDSSNDQINKLSDDVCGTFVLKIDDNDGDVGNNCDS